MPSRLLFVGSCAALLAGCGAYGYTGSAVTRASSIKAPGNAIDGGDASVTAYTLDVGGAKSFGPLSVELGVRTSGDFVSVRDPDGMSVSREGFASSIVYGGVAFAASDRGKRYGSLYLRGGANVIAGGSATERLFEGGLEVCPGHTGARVKLSWCARLGLVMQTGKADASISDPVGDYTSWGPTLSVGLRWDGPR